jgi:predicted phospho-2-dehydro-3-deoxyheptonate aldolase
MSWTTGKKIRMNRIIDETGLILAVPMDNGYTLGPIEGLVDIKKTVNAVFEGGASSVIVHKGNVRFITDAIPKDGGLIIHLSGSTSLSPEANVKLMTGSIYDVIRLGGDAVSCHVNVGPDGDAAMLEDLSRLTEEADLNGLPTLAMMYSRDNDGNNNRDPSVLSHVARIAQEAGADIVKVYSTEDPNKFDEVVQGISIPVVVAGGLKVDNFDLLLDSVEKVILNGAKGISIGRNVFQASDPKLAMQKLKAVVIKAVDEVGPIEILS